MDARESPTGPLARLFRDHYDALCAYAEQLLGSAADAEDVVRSVFAALNDRNTSSQDTHPTALPTVKYLYNAVRDESLAIVRHRNVDRRESSPEPEAGLTDADLVVALQAQDASAFEILFARHFEGLVRYAFYLLGSRDAAKDVVQDLFARIWEHPESFTPSRSVKQYLYSAVRHQVMDVWKHDAVRTRHQAATLATMQANPASASTPSAEAPILDRATLDVAMSKLSPRRQEAIRLRFEDQLSHVEIGQVLGISKDAAERLVHRALADLQKILSLLA